MIKIKKIIQELIPAIIFAMEEAFILTLSTLL